MKRVISALLVFCMMFGLLSTIPAVVSAEGAQSASNEISNLINKVADGLDENNQTNVTLTVPGMTDNLGMDIVYIVGGKLSKATADADSKIQSLKEAISDAIKQGTPVNFGIVTYSYRLPVAMPLTTFDSLEDLENFTQIIEDSFNRYGEVDGWNDGGYNMEQALTNAKALLSGPNSLKDYPERQHIVLYSTGQTFEFNDGANNEYAAVAPVYSTGNGTLYASGGNYAYIRNGVAASNASAYIVPKVFHDLYKKDKETYDSAWDCYWSYITQWVAADREDEASENPKMSHVYHYYKYGDEYNYTINLSASEKKNYPNVVSGKNGRATIALKDLATAHAILYERAMYEAYEYAKANIIDKGINLHAIYNPMRDSLINYSGNTYTNTTDLTTFVGHCFMDMLAGGAGKAPVYNATKNLYFEAVKAKMFYSTAAGSWVEDYIGYEEGKGNFEFIQNPEHIKLVVGGVSYETKVVATKAGADLSLTFTAPDAEKATFELHYYRGNGKTTEKFRWYIYESVSLARPASLTYRLQLTEMREEVGGYIVPANLEATFHPVDSEGNPGKVQYFRIPMVTYIVEIKKTDVEVTKVWRDNDNQDGIRPDSITIKLFADGEDTGKTVVLNAENNWTATFAELDKKANGVDIVYTVQEVKVDGYNSATTGNAADGYIITNTHEIEKTSVKVDKVWNDDNDRDDIRPESVTIKLFANGEDTGKTVVLSEENDWTAFFTGLDKNANGTAIEYTVQEVPVRGYTCEITGNAINGFTVTNTHETEKTRVKVNKVWDDNNDQDGIRPQYVTIKLFANGEDTGKTVVLSATNNWTARFVNLDMNANGVEIEYTVQEVAVEGYTAVITGNAFDGFTVTNIHNAAKTEVKVDKVWVDNNDQDGIRPDSITIKLFANGKDTGKTVVLNAANNWTATFAGLDKNANGAAIEYTVEEVKVDGYTTVITGTAAEGFTITNTHEVAKTEVKVDKVWVDNNNQDGIRPGSVTIKLFADGKDTGKTVVLNAANNWTATFAGLDKNANGVEIKYTVQEVKVDGYTTVITGTAANGYIITNTHEIDKTNVAVNKVWKDNNDQDGIRPDSITIKLFADGKDTGKTVVLNAANNWAATFTGLDKNANGAAIEYTVEEVKVDGYTTVITGNAANGFTVTNTHIASTSITIGGIKYLDDKVAGGFTFVMVDENGNIIGRADSAADGKFIFGTISYNEAGVYKYVITEVAGNNEDIYYDVSAYTVIVTVAVEGEKLVATYELSKDGEAYEGDIEFRNVVLTEIEDEDSPEDDSPDTGDNIGIFMMLGALSVTAFFTMNIFEKSRRKTN